MPLDSTTVAVLERMRRWQQQLIVEGPGVRMKNTEDCCTVYINPPQASPRGSGGNGVLVKVTTPATGAGVYNGFFWNSPTADVDPTANVIEATFGAVSTTACLIFNLDEIAQTTHSITDTAGQMLFMGETFHINSDGTPCVRIDAKPGAACAGT